MPPSSMTYRHFRSVTFTKVWRSRSARPDKRKGIWYRGSPWPANTRSYPHLNRHIPHLSWFFPLAAQNTSFTLHLFVHNTQFESLLSLLTNRLGRARICTSRRASQMEISMCTSYIRTLASTTMRRRSRRRGQRRSSKSPTATLCSSRSQRALLSLCTISHMRGYNLSTFSPHLPHSPHLLLC
jgi:hypothetical protein